MSAQNGNEVRDAAEDVSKELRELGRELRHRANDARKEVVKQLHTSADAIRREARQATDDAEAQKRADELAKGLEKAANYLNSRSVEDMGVEATRVVQRYPLRAVIITFVVGALLGMILSGGNKK
jgi:ElaB/YqjD/DUF883 family membrane-anchored ribosome-binding protein